MNRRSAILTKAQLSGRVAIDDLAEQLSVSTHTIRRDINQLCEQGQLRRLHGGAEFIEAGQNLHYSIRSTLNVAAKKQIAVQAAALVPDASTVFFSIGTTPTLVAAALHSREGLTVVTNNLNAAMALTDAPGVRIVIPGGTIRLPDRDVLGPQVLDLLGSYRADFAIYGVGGIDTDGSLLDFHEDELRVRQQIKDNARCSILVADRTKFGRRAAVVGGHLNQADHVVIDALPDPEYSDLLEQLGDRLVIAGAAS